MQVRLQADAVRQHGRALPLKGDVKLERSETSTRRSWPIHGSTEGRVEGVAFKYTLPINSLPNNELAMAPTYRRLASAVSISDVFTGAFPWRETVDLPSPESTDLNFESFAISLERSAHNREKPNGKNTKPKPFKPF